MKERNYCEVRYAYLRPVLRLGRTPHKKERRDGGVSYSLEPRVRLFHL